MVNCELMEVALEQLITTEENKSMDVSSDVSRLKRLKVIQ